MDFIIISIVGMEKKQQLYFTGKLKINMQRHILRDDIQHKTLKMKTIPSYSHTGYRSKINMDLIT